MVHKKAAKPVTVAVINFNGRAFLDELLTSIANQRFKDFSVLLVDNSSTDGSPDYVRNNYPWVKVEVLPSNLGFARAANFALTQTTTPFLALLNPDMKLEKAWLEQLLDPVLQDVNVAAVASKLRLYDRPHILNGVGGCMNRLGYTWDRGQLEEDRGQYDEPQEVLFASAGAALFRCSAVRSVRAFDEVMFMYHEDVDLCWRLWLKGYRVVTAPEAVAYHHFGGTTRGSRSLLWRELLGERHNIRSLLKNYEAANALRALVGLLGLRQPSRRKLQQLRNFGWNLLKLHDTWAQRRVVQSQRKLADSDLERLIVQSSNVPVRLSDES